MDFGTMSGKLTEGKYRTMEQFKDDMELVFSNCRLFNPPGTVPTICAAVVEKAFKREWPKAMERKLSWTEKRGLQGILTTIVKEPMYVLFKFLDFSDFEGFLSAPGYFANLLILLLWESQPTLTPFQRKMLETFGPSGRNWIMTNTTQLKPSKLT